MVDEVNVEKKVFFLFGKCPLRCKEAVIEGFRTGAFDSGKQGFRSPGRWARICTLHPSESVSVT